MSLIIFLVVGLIAGALASYIMGRQQDLLVNLLIGIIGAVVGGLLGLGAYNLIGEIIIAALGAILCIFVWQRMVVTVPMEAYMRHAAMEADIGRMIWRCDSGGLNG
jgi:uncharacterized membrane protein YeaQ/YmgE (transglycosylase-associated protein family)